jgi:hypothetical protein
MIENKTLSPLKVGLITVSSVWFLFSFHELFKAMVNINEFMQFEGGNSPVAFWIMITDYSGAIGLLARTTAGLLAVIAVVLYIRKGAATSSVMKFVRWILVAEAIYWLSLLLSGVWGMIPNEWAYPGIGAVTGVPALGLTFNMGFVIETGLPCIVESTLLPILLFKLIYELRPSRPQKNALKWGLIAGVAYIFVFWLDNTGNWLYTAFYSTKGIEYLTTYPENIFSFGLTVFGLLALVCFSAYFAKKSLIAERMYELDFRIIGALIVLLGLYFLWNYLTWMFFGRNQLWSDWYAWILGHNMNLWVLAIPLVGLPLMFPEPDPKRVSMEA